MSNVYVRLRHVLKMLVRLSLPMSLLPWVVCCLFARCEQPHKTEHNTHNPELRSLKNTTKHMLQVMKIFFGFATKDLQRSAILARYRNLLLLPSACAGTAMLIVVFLAVKSTHIALHADKFTVTVNRMRQVIAFCFESFYFLFDILVFTDLFHIMPTNVLFVTNGGMNDKSFKRRNAFTTNMATPSVINV